MKRLIPLVLTMAWGWGALAQAPAPLDSLRAIHQLTNEQASKALPVAFQATVTFFRWYDQTLLVQDDGVAIYVMSPANLRMHAGDRVLVRGKTQDSFRPQIIADSVTKVGQAALPQPIAATFDQMSHGQLDSTLVSIQGTIRTADMATNLSTGEQSVVLGLLVDGGLITVNLNSDDPGVLSRLLDCEVEVAGVVSGTFDGKNQLTAIELNVPSIDGIKVLKAAAIGAWSLPVTPMGEILANTHEISRTRRTLVHGVITYYQPGSMAVLESGEQSVEGCVLRGSASVGIAMYPEDGATRDALLTAADAAMYACKNRRAAAI